MHKLQTQLLATTALLALSGAAYAADMPVKAPPVAPAPPVTNWTGFYVGGQIGGGSFDPSCHTFNNYSLDFNADPCFVEGEGLVRSSGSLSSSSFIGGGRVGYDYQWGKVVWGVVGEFDWSHFSGSFQTVLPFAFGNLPAGTTFAAGESLDWLASVRGRVGWAFDNVLFYATGGVAWADLKASASRIDPLAATLDFAVQSSSNKTGAVAGGGFEYRLTPNVSVFGELLWYGFGNTSINYSIAALPGVAFTASFDNQDIVTGTLGVNWRF